MDWFLKSLVILIAARMTFNSAVEIEVDFEDCQPQSSFLMLQNVNHLRISNQLIFGALKGVEEISLQLLLQKPPFYPNSEI